MPSTISKQAIEELAGFLSNFSRPENVENHKELSNLSYDTAKEYFYNNMSERRLASETFKFYDSQLRSFEKFLVQIKKKNLLNMKKVYLKKLKRA